MSGARPFRMVARMPDDVPRDMRHLCKQFPGTRTFIPSNPREGARCSLYAASERPRPCCDQRRFVLQYQRATHAGSSAARPPRGGRQQAAGRSRGRPRPRAARDPAGSRRGPGTRPRHGPAPDRSAARGGARDRSSRARLVGSGRAAKARPAAGRREASAGHGNQSGRGRARLGTGVGQGRPGLGTRAGGDGPGGSRTRTRHAGPRGPVDPAPGRFTLAPPGACRVSRERFVTQITRQGEHGAEGDSPRGW